MSTKDVIAANLRTLRKVRGLSQPELAAKVGISPRTIARLEAAQVADPSINHVRDLARALGVKSAEPCSVEAAQRHSGYLVGGTSPFGTRKLMPVCVESSVLALPRIWINGGRRGFLVGIEPAVLSGLLGARAVDCAI